MPKQADAVAEIQTLIEKYIRRISETEDALLREEKGEYFKSNNASVCKGLNNRIYGVLCIKLYLP